NLHLTLTAKAEEEKIFGAITAADLAAALQEKGIEVDRKNITVDSVKTLGEFEATAKLHREVKATIKFAVVAE
ncbi:MAG: 50S ribosomal protein L9, partial [Alistipes sp.]|nr:50S ribosomal protein L9 [Alistipes sp.]